MPLNPHAVSHCPTVAYCAPDPTETHALLEQLYPAPPEPVTVKVTVRVWLGLLLSIIDFPLKVIVPVCCPKLNPAGFAVTVTFSDALPEAPFVRPVLSEVGETESQLAFELAPHVSVDPGAPVLVMVTGCVTAAPFDAAVGDHAFWLMPMVAIGSQRMT